MSSIIFFLKIKKKIVQIYIFIYYSIWFFFLSAGVGYASSTIGWCAPMGHVGP